MASKEDVSDHRITIYTLSTCPHCAGLKQFLKEKKIAYEGFDVGENPLALEAMQKISSQNNVPVIVIDGEVHVGFDRSWLNEKLGLNRYDFNYFG